MLVFICCLCFGLICGSNNTASFTCLLFPLLQNKIRPLYRCTNSTQHFGIYQLLPSTGATDIRLFFADYELHLAFACSMNGTTTAHNNAFSQIYIWRNSAFTVSAASSPIFSRSISDGDRLPHLSYYFNKLNFLLVLQRKSFF